MGTQIQLAPNGQLNRRQEGKEEAGRIIWLVLQHNNDTCDHNDASDLNLSPEYDR